MITGSASEPAMTAPQQREESALAPKLAAPQHRPRPLPLFLALLRSMTDGDAKRMQAALAGLKRYQEAEREAPRPLMPVVADAHGASLRDYGPGSRSGAGSAGPPL